MPDRIRGQDFKGGGMSYACPEPKITVNGEELTPGQAMTLRVALTKFVADMRDEGLGDDEMGKHLAKGYIERGNEVLQFMLKRWR
jgi:hypothetical protein